MKSLPPFSLHKTLTVGLVSACVLFSLMKPVGMIDLGVFLRMGAWMVEHGRLLEVEPFSIVAEGRTYQNGTWLSQIVLYSLHALGGYPLLQVGLALSVALTFILTLSQRVVGVLGWRCASLAAFIVFAGILQNLAIRPQTFSLPLFALVVYQLVCHTGKRWVLGSLALTMALWANLHGAFPIVFLYPVVFGIDAWVVERDPARVKRWALLGGAMLLGTLVNPYGIALYRYVLSNSAMPVERGLVEWLPPDPTSFLGMRFLVLIALSVMIGVRARAHLRPSDILIFAALTVLGMRSRRMIVWWGLGMAPVVARWVAMQWPSWTRPPRIDRVHTLLGWAMVAFWVLIGGVGAVQKLGAGVDERGDYAGLEEETPVGAARFLATKPGGRLFHRLEWGSYFMWRLWPGWRTFMDIRVWIYDDASWERYLTLSRAEGDWDGVLARYGITALALSKETQQPLIEAVRHAARWRLEYEDERAAVFTLQQSARVR